MKHRLIALFTVLTIQTAVAQSPVATRIRSGADLGLAFKKDNYQPSFTYYQLLNIGQQKLFSLGWTLKISRYFGDNLNYTTAPARLTRGQTGFAALSAPLINENIDTVRFDYIVVTSANVGIRGQVNLGPVEIGASADLFGLALGGRRTGRYISSTATTTNADGNETSLSNALQRAAPTRFNLRMLGDNDYGTLATEVYARVRVNQRLAVKAGCQWLTTEMRTDVVNTVDGNQRFRNRTGPMPYVAVTFPFFY